MAHTGKYDSHFIFFKKSRTSGPCQSKVATYFSSRFMCAPLFEGVTDSLSEMTDEEEEEEEAKKGHVRPQKGGGGGRGERMKNKK